VSGKLRQSVRGIGKSHRKVFRKIDRVRRGKSLLGELGVRDGNKRKPEDVIGYDGENFTRNGKKTTRDSLRMG
jgi:hypothetical protein